MSTNPVRGRFAPSPSGRMHLGNALCALLAWLSVRHQNGKMVLRIEDLDPDRCKPDYARQLEDDLHWLGLDWDEGGCDDTAGKHTPYLQSKRSDIYAAQLDLLAQQGLVYPCYCTRAALHDAQAPHLSDGGSVYSGHCRACPPPSDLHRAPAIRLMVPEETIAFTDGRMGQVSEYLPRDCGDFIIRRSDGVFAYQLAVVVDDALMGITEVVRGSDLLGSTPRQLYLYRLLGFAPPTFYHLPLLLAPDGRRLSKRDGDLDLQALRSRFAASELIGQLAFLCGLLPFPAAVTARELVPLFSWDKLTQTDIRLSPDRF